MTATLDDLVKMEGVVMAFEFTADGKCTAYKNVTPEMAAMAAKFCALVTMEFSLLADSFSNLSEQPWTPQQGWMYRGGKYTAIAGNGGYWVVFVETAKANVPALLEMLHGTK